MKYYLLLAILFSKCMLANEDSLNFAGIPALSFDSDNGFGYGLIGSMYNNNPSYDPYKYSLDGQFFLTTKNYHSHFIRFDKINPFSLPLRLISKLGFLSNISQNYCGKASDSSCSEETAKLSVKDDELRKHFYQNRFMSINASLIGHWLISDKFGKFKLATNYFGNYYLHRDFTNTKAYPGSLYEKDFSEHKEEGYLSSIEAGLILDKRNTESSTTQGYLLEASIRGAHKYTLSSWDYVAGNLSARFFWPLIKDKSLVFAHHFIADSIYGDLTFDAMSKVGGMNAINDYSAFGGQYLGRGISRQMFVGRIKFIKQMELRYQFLSFDLLKQNFDLSAVLFSDLGMVAWDYDRFAKDMKKLHAGFGSGIRIHWNKNFIVRADVGFSPSENYSPKVYIVVGQTF